MDASTRIFDFAWSSRYRVAARPFGITERNASVRVTARELVARFGPWKLVSDLANVEGAELTGPFSFVRTAGPAHLSLVDRGLTMASNGERGVCIRFREPVRGIEPTGRVRHPGLTVTVADCEGLVAALTRR